MRGINKARQKTILAARQEVSPFLYIAGFFVALCSLLAASEALNLDSFAPTMIPLTVLGFIFSFSCRWWDVRSPVIQFLPFCIVALLVAGVANSVSSLTNLFGNGEQFQEQQLLVFISSLVVLLSWALIRDTVLLFCCVPALVTISLAANIAISPLTVFCYFGYILAASFVLAHQNYLQHRNLIPDAEPRRNVSMALIGQAGAACVCAILALILGTSLVIPAEAIFKQSTIRDAAREMASIAPRRAAALSLQTSFTEGTRFDIGSGGFGSNDTTVLIKMTPDDRAPHYWTGRTYNQYSGDGWLSKRETPAYLLQLDNTSGESDSPDASAYTLTRTAKNDLGLGRTVTESPTLKTTVEVVGNTDQYYYTGLPQSIAFEKAQAEPPTIAADGKMYTDLGQHPSLNYTVVSNVSHEVGDLAGRKELIKAGTGYPVQIRDYYLGAIKNGVTKPEDIAFFQSAVAEALRGLSPKNRTPFEKAEAIQTWISHRCVYSLNVSPTPRQVDHVHYFLGTSHKGYCDLYASSMAVLCRTAGIPARVVTGFAPGVPNATGYDVRIKDKHAWAEVFFPGSGWVIFDPTIGTTEDDSLGTKAAGPVTWRDRLGFLFAHGPIPVVLLVFIIGLLAYVVKTEISSRRLKISGGWTAGAGGYAAERIAAIDRYDQMTRAIAWLSARRPSETPLEYAARLQAVLAAEEQRLHVSLYGETLQLLTAHFILARYGDKGAFGARLKEIEGSKAAAGTFIAAARHGRMVQLFHLFDRKPQNAKPVATHSAV